MSQTAYLFTISKKIYKLSSALKRMLAFLHAGYAAGIPQGELRGVAAFSICCAVFEF